MANNIIAALQPLGFEPVTNAVCVGTWRNYAVALQRFSGQSYYAYLAIRIPAASKELRKTLKDALKAAGVRSVAVNRVMPNFVHLTINFTRSKRPDADFSGWMDLVVGTLAQNGVQPANTCAVTGAPNPDSLCLMTDSNCFGYQPVFASAVRQKESAVQAKAEENDLSGSYATGLIGAVLGTLVGIAVNMLTMFFLHRIFVWLFALIPICAFFGYKLFKGKMDKMAIVFVIALSVLAIPLMMILNLALEAAKELKISFGEAFGWSVRNITHPTIFKELTGDLLKVVLFMALGVFIAFGFMKGQLNSTQLQGVKAQMETIRPNPLCSFQPQAGQPAAPQDPTAQG